MSKATGSSSPGFEVMEAAAHWFALLQSGNVSDDDHHAWRNWLSAKPEHSLAWQRVESVGQQCQQVKALDHNREALTRALKAERIASKDRRRMLQGLGALAGIAVVAGLSGRAYLYPMSRTLLADYRTATGEKLPLYLDDGTELWLNTATAIDVDYSSTLRHISLIKGEILVDTGSDSRPMLISTLQGDIQPIGTRFAVRTGDDISQLSVYEGAVEISNRDQSKATIAAGNQTSFTTRDIAAVKAARETDTAWLKSRLVVQAMPLRSFIDELQRYHRAYINLDPAIANLRVMGTFPTDDPDHALNMLADILPVQVNRPLPWWISVKAK